MFRWLLIVSLGSLLAWAEDEVAVSETGWWHSKQAGRYGAIEAETEPEKWIDGIEADATLRTLWIDEHFGSQKTTATAVGGFVGIATPEWNGFSAMARVYTSQRLWGINPTDTAMVDTVPYDGTSGFTYLGEAEVRYSDEDLSFRAGRIRLQTPFADEDDIRMAPNTFEGAEASYEVDHTALHLLALNRWAGFDSTDGTGNQSGFKEFAPDSKGMAALGLVHSPSEKTEYNAWGYVADRLFELIYLEAAGHHYFEPQLHLEWGVQYAQMWQRDASGVEGGVYGAMALMHYDNVYFGGAYNYADVSRGGYVTDGFGGGPYYTSLDESTVAGVSGLVPGQDVSVYRVGGGADIAWWQHGEDEGLHLEAVYGRFDIRDSAVAVKESDVLLWFGLGEALRVDAVFAKFDIDHTPDPAYDDFHRYWVRVDYAF